VIVEEGVELGGMGVRVAIGKVICEVEEQAERSRMKKYRMARRMPIF